MFTEQVHVIGAVGQHGLAPLAGAPAASRSTGLARMASANRLFLDVVLEGIWRSASRRTSRCRRPPLHIVQLGAHFRRQRPSVLAAPLYSSSARAISRLPAVDDDQRFGADRLAEADSSSRPKSLCSMPFRQVLPGGRLSRGPMPSFQSYPLTKLPPSEYTAR